MNQLGLDELGPLPAFLRQRSGDVVPIVTPVGDRMWLVRDYTLARMVLTDARFSRAQAVAPHAPKPNDAQPVPASMMSMDGTEHARLRRIIAGTFTSGRVSAMSPYIERLVGGHLDTIAAAGPGADLMELLAVPLPLAVVCALLGVPREDSRRFATWVEVLFDISASTPREKARHRLELARYMAGLVDRKRREPGEDLLTALIGRHDGGELSMTELVTMGLSLLMAGYETTVGQIGLSVLLLLSDPAMRDGLLARPAPAVEELLRLNPSTPLSFPRASWSPCSTRTGTSGCSRNRQKRTGAAPCISPSVTARTAAPAPRWPGCRCRQPYSACCAASRHCASPTAPMRWSGRKVSPPGGWPASPCSGDRRTASHHGTWMMRPTMLGCTTASLRQMDSAVRRSGPSLR
jgi:hypothetical protein